MLLRDGADKGSFTLSESNFFYFYRPERSCGKVMFLHVSVILFTGEGASLSQHAPQVTRPRGSLSSPGGSWSGGLCADGGLCPEEGGLCLGGSVWGGGSLSKGGLCPGGSL